MATLSLDDSTVVRSDLFMEKSGQSTSNGNSNSSERKRKRDSDDGGDSEADLDDTKEINEKIFKDRLNGIAFKAIAKEFGVRAGYVRKRFNKLNSQYKRAQKELQRRNDAANGLTSSSSKKPRQKKQKTEDGSGRNDDDNNSNSNLTLIEKLKRLTPEQIQTLSVDIQQKIAKLKEMDSL